MSTIDIFEKQETDKSIIINDNINVKKGRKIKGISDLKAQED